MKFIINRESLLKSLTMVGRAIASKNIIPALSNYKMVLLKDQLEITGSNGDVSIVDKISAVDTDGSTVISVEREGSCLAVGRLGEIIRKMSGYEVSIELIDGSVLKVGDGKSSFKLVTMNTDEFPSFDFSTKQECEIQIKTEEFLKCSNQVAFAASTKDAKPMLMAVNFQANAGKMSVSATDTARLSRKVIDISTNKNLKANISARTITDVAKMAEESSDITIGILDTKAYFIFGTTTVFTSIIAGEYPNVSSVISHGFSIDLQVSASEMIETLERVSVLSLERNVAAKLKVSSNELKINCKSPTLGSVEEVMSKFTFDSEDFEIAFNCDYVLSALKALNQEDVIFQFGGAFKPFVIKSDKEPTLIQVVTPLRFMN